MTTTEPEIEAEIAAEVSPQDEPESFGTWLRRQREVREITLREIADTSKISIRYLQAMEENRFDLLPAAVFAKGFLRQYARYVGLDPEEAVNFFLAARGQGDEEPVETPQRAPQSLTPSGYAVLAVVVAVILMLVVWGLTRLNQGQAEELNETPTAPASATSGDANPQAGRSERTASPSGSEADAPGPAETEPAAGAEHGTEAGLPESDPSDARPAVTGRPETDPPGVRRSKVEPTQSTQPAPRPPAALVVTVDFRGDCWVQAAIDDLAQESRVYVQGESVQLEAQQTVDLKLGNILVADVEVNGHPLTFKNGNSAVRELRIDLETAAALAASGGNVER